MLSVFEGFWTIAVVVGVGWVLAARRVLPDEAIDVLSRLTFSVATPLLLFTVVARAELSTLFSPHLAISVLASVVIAGVHAVLARRWVASAGETVIHAFAAGYVNSANLGIPIAVYVLGDAVHAVPVMLGQLLLLQPLGLAVLDAADPAMAHRSRAGALLRSLANPLILGSAAGVAVALSGWELPAGLMGPLDLLAGMSVPAMLLAYGMSLRLGPRPFSGGERAPVVLASVMKLLVMPVVAWGMALLWGLRGHELLVVVVTAALPTAQNVFLLATVYRHAQVVARDVVFATTMLSLPAILLVVALLG